MHNNLFLNPYLSEYKTNNGKQMIMMKKNNKKKQQTTKNLR